FHRVAANIIELAISGRKIEAAKLMYHNTSEYSLVSTELVNDLQAWLNKISR
ncbi:MAG: hypothetical protein HYZ23_01565, partial [Chloroflexi bacterium]|nr:hypothetical protein [Chloroflexota bacterium]